jgi:hypothetical protein
VPPGAPPMPAPGPPGAPALPGPKPPVRAVHEPSVLLLNSIEVAVTAPVEPALPRACAHNPTLADAEVVFAVVV